MIKNKRAQVVEHVREGRYKEALRVCKSWNLPITTEESTTLKRGYECMVNPRFYVELGYNPSLEIEKAISILNKIYLEG